MASVNIEVPLLSMSLLPKRKRTQSLLLGLIIFVIAIQPSRGLIKQSDQFKPFNGIPAAFGDLNADRRTDIVVISGDGHILNIYYQQQKQPVFHKGFSCRCDRRISQVYLADIENDGFANVLPLLVSDQRDQVQYELVSLKTEGLPSVGIMAALESGGADALSISSDNVNLSANVNESAIAEALRRSPPTQVEESPEPCKYDQINVFMKKQPLLFDLEGDLQIDFMSVDTEDRVTVWKPPKDSGHKEFDKMNSSRWDYIDASFFKGPHSHSFIDMNRDAAADIVFSSQQHIMYAWAEPDIEKTFKQTRNFTNTIMEQLENQYELGQSSLVDINADGLIDHVIPCCKRPPERRTCEIVVLHENGKVESIYKFENNSNEFTLETVHMGAYYEFPITLRSGDLDGDGFTDFVAIVRATQNNKNRIAWLRNVEDERTKSPSQQSQLSSSIGRTFQMHEVPFEGLTPKEHVKLVILFDINEDGKVDMLIGSSEVDKDPRDLRITARMNSQMVDACFMKVLVTNGYCGQDSCSTTVSNGQSARGPFICFELSQNDGKVRKGCAGQLSQSSHFALHAPYVIFGLGQTPHFVETLTVTIPGFGIDRKVRERTFEQIVPDAQVIIIPNPKEYPNNWDYKLFLSPMSDLVLSTLITLAVICLVILLIICMLHHKESLEDLAEHEEYKRHWPESR